ncbi:MAG: 4-hydroxy-tetrahydrodipicolinate reductase [Planctomycetota bacterium]|nr:MAG: 4-hydroxy-tetrahydrodipicolinate reductase [Planctomycetota bacterium]
MIKLGLNGASGRMGKRISALINQDKNCKLVSAIEYPESPDLGKDIGDINGEGSMGVKISHELDTTAECLIDFSQPNSTIKMAQVCQKNKIAFVTGTTGLNDAQLKELKDLSEQIPILIGSNMSIGVNLLFRFASQIAKALGDDYDIEIIEKHHRFKKDAPSGTALSIAESIAEGIKRDLKEVGIYGREGQVGERTQKEIALHSVRAGDIVGEHTIIYGALGETIELTHRAHTRDTFASGAIKAGKWLANKDPGLYTMYDVLNL